MPGFSFEKILPPPRIETGSPLPANVRRGAIVRFLDRLTFAKLQKSENDIRRIAELTRKLAK